MKYSSTIEPSQNEGDASIDEGQPVMRLRITFAKTGEMRYTGHLDLYRAWERTLRRAGLPLAYSQGFNPRPRIQIASALPLGFTSQHEVVDVWLETELVMPRVKGNLQKAAPPGIRILQVDEVDLRAPALQAQLASAEYTVTLLERVEDLDSRLRMIREAHSLLRERRGKAYDLRPLVEVLARIPEDELRRQRIHMRLAAQEGATGRPEEVLLEMGLSPHRARVERTGLIFQVPQSN
jgi:radical SAM-linked protein